MVCVRHGARNFGQSMGIASITGLVHASGTRCANGYARA